VVADLEAGPHGRWLQVGPDGIQDMPWARAARFADPDGNPLVLQTVPAA
jgi:hypothetical protein